MNKTFLLLPLVLALASCAERAQVAPPRQAAEPRATAGEGRANGPVAPVSAAIPPVTALGSGGGGIGAVQPGDLPGAEPMTLNFADADIREIARTILGDALRVTYTIDPLVRGTATISSERPLPPAELLRTLQTLLVQNGASLIVTDGIYRITPLAANGAGNALVGSGDASAGTVVVPLRFASARDLAKVLEPFVGAGAQIAADPARNVLLVSGEPTARAGLLDLVRAFDTDMLRRQSYAVFPVRNGEAAAAAADLAQAMGAGGEGPLSGVVRISPLRRANGVLVVAPEAHFIEQARRLFAMVDRAGDAMARSWHVYYVQNGQVGDMERVLQRAFMGGGEAASGDGMQTAPGLEHVTMSTQGGTGTQGGINPGLQGGQIPGTGPQQQMAGSDPLQPPAVLAPPTDTGDASYAPAGGGKQDGIRIVANKANNALLIYSNEEEQRMIEGMLRKIDILPLQVRIDATIAEVSLTDDLRYGTQFFFQDGGLTGTLSNNRLGLPVGEFPGFVLARGVSSARFALSALQSVTNVNVLSAPQIVAVDNQPAFLQVGDTVPYISQTAVSTQNPDAPIVNSIQYRDTGVILQVTPRINAGGLVSLDIVQEVSDVVETTSSRIDSPTFPQRRLRSRVVVEDGQTIGMAGLIRDGVTEGNSGLPFLKNIPVFGTLFGTQDNTRRRTELLVLITPHVIHDQRDARALTEDLRQTLQGADSVPQTLETLPVSGSANPNGFRRRGARTP